MNNKSLVKLSNTIGIISIALLVYWVFIFISITVFGLKVFRENITETFYLSIVGILALMTGSLIINLMFNLTRIAEKHNADDSGITSKSTTKGVRMALWMSFPLILIFLFVGDFLTSRTRQTMLIASAKSVIENDPKKSDVILDYKFSKEWILQTERILELYSKTDEHFATISVIVKDTIGDSKVFLGFGSIDGMQNDTLDPVKMKFIRKTNHEERDYLDKVFNENGQEVKFISDKGHYELYYPFIKNNKRVVLYFSDFGRYGKMGSY